MKTDVAIVGGGLTGLAIADRLHRGGVDFRLFEARSRLGGRISVMKTADGAVDLGPSWFWPGQPRIAALIEDLGLRAFLQHAAGDICFEDEAGQIHRGQGFASMEGSFRLAGGMTGLIEGLAGKVPAERIHLSCPITGIVRSGETLTLEGAGCAANRVVLALPPRIAAGLRFDPVLPPEILGTLKAIPTWMAAHAKFVAAYDRPFWRDAGLSGDAMSRRGPMMEMHDASGPDASPAALFGFLGIPAAARLNRSEDITAASLGQLGRLFGPEAMAPRHSALKDWAHEAETATALDHDPPRGHPAYGMPAVLRDIRDGRLFFAATETASEMGGLMEGALAAAEHVSLQVLGYGA
jgi:monoamine oxidase